jgi:hypothetical protein
VSKIGFKALNKPDIVLNVQDALARWESRADVETLEKIADGLGIPVWRLLMERRAGLA